MDLYLEFARGPLFIMTLLFMVLALGRMIAINKVVVPMTLKARGEEDGVDTRSFKDFMKENPSYATLSVAWYGVLFVTAVFLTSHILLWSRGLGVSLPLQFTLNRRLGDILAVSALVLTIMLFLMRAASAKLKSTSTPADVPILIFAVVLLLTGILSVHPVINPMNYSLTTLTHVLSAEAIFVLVPYTQICRAVFGPPADPVVAEDGLQNRTQEGGASL